MIIRMCAHNPCMFALISALNLCLQLASAALLSISLAGAPLTRQVTEEEANKLGFNAEPLNTVSVSRYAMHMQDIGQRQHEHVPFNTFASWWG